MTASQQHYWEMGSGEWVAVAYLAYMGEPLLDVTRRRRAGCRRDCEPAAGGVRRSRGGRTSVRQWAAVSARSAPVRGTLAVAGLQAGRWARSRGSGRRSLPARRHAAGAPSGLTRRARGAQRADGIGTPLVGAACREARLPPRRWSLLRARWRLVRSSVAT